MGMLVDGNWVDENRTIKDGAYVRAPSAYKDPLNATTLRLIPEYPGRFHLIASLSCPWSHRTLLARAFKGLADAIPIHVAHGPRTQGYRAGMPDTPWQIPGDGKSIVHLHELYTTVAPHYTGRVTVPILWDATERRIVSNESAVIVAGFDQVRASNNALDWTLRPPDLDGEIETLATQIQTQLSNAVYRAGKAQRQEIYEAAVNEVFACLAMLEQRLEHSRFLHGNTLTETDLRLWPTLARFDAVYAGHFKCSRHRLIDYRHLWGYARDLHTIKGVAATFDEPEIRTAYYGEDTDINPHGIIATAPTIDWSAPHARDDLGPAEVSLRDGRRIRIDPRFFIKDRPAS